MLIKHPKGKMGEDLAAQYLTNNHWYIIHRNWHCRFGEIDIIAQKNTTLVFFEVKLRSNDSFGGAIYSITPKKMAKMRSSILKYLQQNPYGDSIRVDALLIQQNQSNKIEHIENIMDY